jgi:hypothetical protein
MERSLSGANDGAVERERVEVDEESEKMSAEAEAEKVLTRMAEVYENERYQLSTMNWSSNGLLINDR